jgi:predicted O-methyltransferase YrrM
MIHTLVSAEIEKYCSKHTTPESKSLVSLNRKTNLEVQLPQMLSGHLQGAFLSMLSHMIKPTHILEIGTYTGYSAICLAQGLHTNGKLITIDVNEELKDLCESYFKETNLTDKITMLTGKAIDIIPTLEHEFDVVFIDADKINYNNYYDLVFEKVKQGGYIIADNVLYSSEVITETMGKHAKAMDAYNKKIIEDKRVECLLVPLRDGLMICRKL